MNITFKTAALALTALSLAGCSSVRNAYNSITGSNSAPDSKSELTLPSPSDAEINTDDMTALQTEDIIDHIIFGRWTIVDAAGNAVDAPEDGERPYIVFDSTAVNPFFLKVYAFTGCNTVNGRLALTQGGKLQPTGNFASTLRLCPDATAEADIMTALTSVQSYRLERIDNNYILYFFPAEPKSNNPSLVLRRNDMSFLDGLWNVTAIPPTKIKPDDMPDPMQLVFDIPEGRLHGNTGCNILNAAVSTDIMIRNSISITDPVTTRMACPNAGLEQQLSSALLKAVTAIPDGSSKVNLLDAAGNIVLSLSRPE